MTKIEEKPEAKLSRSDRRYVEKKKQRETRRKLATAREASKRERDRRLSVINAIATTERGKVWADWRAGRIKP